LNNVWLFFSTFKLFGSQPFWLWSYLMNFIPETCHAHEIRYLCICYSSGNFYIFLYTINTKVVSFYSNKWRVVLITTFCNNVHQWLVQDVQHVPHQKTRGEPRCSQHVTYFFPPWYIWKIAHFPLNNIQFLTKRRKIHPCKIDFTGL
jgi:hypothetical protein